MPFSTYWSVKGPLWWAELLWNRYAGAYLRHICLDSATEGLHLFWKRILDAISNHIYHSDKDPDTIPARKVSLTTNQRWMAVGSYAKLINKFLHLRLSWCMLLDSIKIVAMSRFHTANQMIRWSAVQILLGSIEMAFFHPPTKPIFRPEGLLR